MRSHSDHPADAPSKPPSLASPAVDRWIIGGGLALPVTFAAVAWPDLTPSAPAVVLPAFVLANYAHFAGSTVRLYGARGGRPVGWSLGVAFPLIMLALVVAATRWPVGVGRHLEALYLTWSPFHYAAQTWGLALMFCMRAGCQLRAGERRALKAAALLPFCWALLMRPDGGVAWLAPASALADGGWVSRARELAAGPLAAAIVAAPLLLFWRRRATMPPIVLTLLGANAAWWLLLGFGDAFFWATIFHALQYLAIAAAFEQREHTLRGGRPSWRPALRFYTRSVALGALLFLGVPAVFVAAGVDYLLAMTAVVAGINIHHFVVDGVIWRLARDARNRAVVTPGAAAPGVGAASGSAGDLVSHRP